MPNIDFTPITSSVDAFTVIGAFLALGVVYALIDFTLWVVRQVGSFFDWVDFYRHGDMDHDPWHERFGRVNSVLNKVGLGR
ncbi:hypothetical protein ACUXAV_002851 [Cupriavidus metallidurans]|uniref:hypothetical protein n=1 Tax=Cupriavidus metallidurans TaxID=119219 RepID=UPI00049305C0|nr:hypothetical protein [Cupriavidus metallidurans]MDE4919812.1 hypothetical protein [Cupriavidus metallidurans]